MYSSNRELKGVIILTNIVVIDTNYSRKNAKIYKRKGSDLYENSK